MWVCVVYVLVTSHFRKLVMIEGDRQTNRQTERGRQTNRDKESETDRGTV